jgi:hypothetical protein
LYRGHKLLYSDKKKPVGGAISLEDTITREALCWFKDYRVKEQKDGKVMIEGPVEKEETISTGVRALIA